jgi:putative hydrolase of the HAD superfamily
LSPLFGRRLVCSGSVGTVKPAPEAFAACLQRLGFSAMSTLCVDDREDNVAGAIEAGLDAARFDGIAGLRAVLRARDFDLGDDDAS